MNTELNPELGRDPTSPFVDPVLNGLAELAKSNVELLQLIRDGDARTMQLENRLNQAQMRIANLERNASAFPAFNP